MSFAVCTTIVGIFCFFLHIFVHTTFNIFLVFKIEFEILNLFAGLYRISLVIFISNFGKINVGLKMIEYKIFWNFVHRINYGLFPAVAT
jgi:hypothetical protein